MVIADVRIRIRRGRIPEYSTKGKSNKEVAESHDQNLPAEEAPEKEGARLPQENEDCRWQTRSQEKTRKGQKETDLLIGISKIPQRGRGKILQTDYGLPSLLSAVCFRTEMFGGASPHKSPRTDRP